MMNESFVFFKTASPEEDLAVGMKNLTLLIYLTHFKNFQV